jgi:hypothetical protein
MRFLPRNAELRAVLARRAVEGYFGSGYATRLPNANFLHEGGTPIAEVIFKGGAIFRQVDNARVREFGAASECGQVRGRMIGNDDGDPMIICFSLQGDQQQLATAASNLSRHASGSA